MLENLLCEKCTLFNGASFFFFILKLPWSLTVNLNADSVETWNEWENFSAMRSFWINFNFNKKFSLSCFSFAFNVLGAFVGLDRGSKFSNTEILERETNDASLDATVETRRENKEKEKNSLGKKDYAMIMTTQWTIYLRCWRSFELWIDHRVINSFLIFRTSSEQNEDTLINVSVSEANKLC